MDDDDSIPISALQHYLYCPRQWALIHLERVWTENVQTAQGRLLHQRSDEPAAGQRHGVRTLTALSLRHAELGLVGVADVVEIRPAPDGKTVVFPIEYKRGRPKSHRADDVQLCAQALCLEAMMNVDIEEGAIFYGQTRHRHSVVFDQELRQLTTGVIADIREKIRQKQTPIIAYDAGRCTHCSLIDDCQPMWLNRKQSVADWLLQQLRREQG